MYAHAGKAMRASKGPLGLSIARVDTSCEITRAARDITLKVRTHTHTHAHTHTHTQQFQLDQSLTFTIA